MATRGRHTSGGVATRPIDRLVPYRPTTLSSTCWPGSPAVSMATSRPVRFERYRASSARRNKSLTAGHPRLPSVVAIPQQAPAPGTLVARAPSAAVKQLSSSVQQLPSSGAALAAGASLYMTKPFHPHALAGQARALVEGTNVTVPGSDGNG